MGKSSVFIILVIVGVSFQASVSKDGKRQGLSYPEYFTFNYPDVKRDESVVDDFFGTKIVDPYRWLESNSKETKEFIEQQNKLSKSYTHDNPYRDAIKKRLTELKDYEKFGCPTVAGGKYYYKKNSGLQNQYVYYVQDSLNGEPKVFIDPNTLSEDGTIALKGTYFSDDGEILAYQIQKSGSDWRTLSFKNVTTGKDFPDKLEHLKFASVKWDKENSGVYYTRYDPDDSTENDGTETTRLRNQKLYFHKIGTNQSEDILLVEFPENPKWIPEIFLSEKKEYAIILVQETIGTDQIFYARLSEFLKEGKPTELKLTPIVDKFEASFVYITEDNGILYFTTDKDAPNYKVVGIDLAKPQEENWITVVPENPKDKIEAVTAVNKNLLIVNYIRDVKNVLELRHLTDKNFTKILTPHGIGEINMCNVEKRSETELFYTFESYLTPNKIYHINFSEETLTPTVWKESKLKNYKAEDFKTVQVFYTSTDGTKVPMYITHKKNLELNGQNPTKLYAYGGYGISILPSFSEEDILLMQNFGGVSAVANIRGGGEYGTKWWNAGRLLNKQQGFNDFQAAAEYLIQEKYTNPSKLYIQGGSLGGLLVATCVNQRPELYGGALPEVGVYDMLRAHKFTIGYVSCSEIGCADNKTEFENLVKYSPFQNVHMPANETAQYPAILVTTGDHDDRAVPLHSYKFISELQHTIGKNQRQKNPLMIRVERDAGHGSGKPISKQIEEITDQMSFLMKSLDYKFQETTFNL